jgi:hypothetical protein
MSKTSVSQLAYYLALIGGILMVILGLLGLLQSSFGRFYFSWGFAYGGIVTLICGVIAIMEQKAPVLLFGRSF